MRILYVANIRLPSSKAHGAQIMKSCEAFALLGNDVTLIVPNWAPLFNESPFTFYKVRNSFSIIRALTLDLPWKNDFLFFSQIYSFTLSVILHGLWKNYDVIYCRDEQIVAAVANVFGPKVIWESHDGSWTRLAQIAAREAKKIIVVTKRARDVYIQRGVPSEKVSAVSNGIDLSEFLLAESKEAARKRLGISATEKIALYVGRMDARRGISTLLDAAFFLDPGTRLVVIGDGMDLQKLRDTYPHVSFLAFRPYGELASNLASADVLVLPQTAKDEISAHLSSPLKLFAYLAAGKPIVSSDLPSIREIADDSEVLFIQPDDARKLAEGINVIIRNPLLGAQLAEKALFRAQSLDWVSRARRISAFFD